MPPTHGFFPPRTATGASALIPAPPWRYSGDLLTVEYRTDVERVRELLPPPLEPADEDPGAVALIWADWQSCSDSGAELLDPVRSQYKEAFAVVRCAYRGRTYSRCVHIWVDKDFALARGLHQGYPKKLGSIHQTRPHPYGPAPRVAAGARFGATLAAADRRIAQAVITLREPAETAGFVNAHPMAHHRLLPSIEKGRGPSLDELVESGAAAVESGPAWRGEAELDLFPSPTEELSRLVVREPIAAYFHQVGVVWDGGRLLATGTSSPPPEAAPPHPAQGGPHD
ncbi:acetoacetate decarboxylase family protein [Streptomyces sp. NPDC047315]|uniref:acetoacetate decarboxylase family protein n=1 Tax=Streptomyces sp. NPDC047315 TaxID=3155142 RepID=UPI0033E72594